MDVETDNAYTGSGHEQRERTTTTKHRVTAKLGCCAAFLCLASSLIGTASCIDCLEYILHIHQGCIGRRAWITWDKVHHGVFGIISFLR